MSHGLYTNQAHYMPFSGEISAMKIQGEGRNWPDAGLIFTPGQCGYDESLVQNPTTMTCPIEMSMQETRYRRMLTPDVQMHVQVPWTNSVNPPSTPNFKYHESYSPPVGDKLHPTSEIKWSDFYGKNKVYKAQASGSIYTGNAINRSATEQSYYFAGSKNVGVSKSGTYVTNYGGFVAAAFPNHTDAAGFTTSSTTGGTWRSHTVNPQATQINFAINRFIQDRKSDGTYGAMRSIPNYGTVTHLVWYTTNPGIGAWTGSGYILVCHLNILGRIYIDRKSLNYISWPSTASAVSGWTTNGLAIGPNYASFHTSGQLQGVDISYEGPTASNNYYGQTTFRAYSRFDGNGPTSLPASLANTVTATEHPIGIAGQLGNYSETT